jgi:hypothetical protein
MKRACNGRSSLIRWGAIGLAAWIRGEKGLAKLDGSLRRGTSTCLSLNAPARQNEMHNQESMDVRTVPALKTVQEDGNRAGS